MVLDMLNIRHQEELQRLAAIDPEGESTEALQGHVVSTRLALNAQDYNMFLPEVPSVAARYPRAPLWQHDLTGHADRQLSVPFRDDKARVMEELSRAVLKQLTAIEGGMEDLRDSIIRLEGNQEAKRDILTRAMPLTVTPLADAIAHSSELFQHIAQGRRQAVLAEQNATTTEAVQALAKSPTVGPYMFSPT